MFPAAAQYVYQANYRDNTSLGVENTISNAKRTFNALGESLSAFELGNEISCLSPTPPFF